MFLAKPKGSSVGKEEYLVIPTICFVHVCHFVYHRGAQRKRVQERGKAFHKSERNLLTSRLSFLRLFYLRPDSSAQECSISDLLRTAGFGHTSSLRKRMNINKVNVT